MALKKEHTVFIKHYLKTSDHIESYIKAVPGTDRKVAATSGKRWLKNAAIAAEIAKSRHVDSVEIDEVEEIQQLSDEKPHVLSPKEERFCQEYLVDLNATQAAIRAGYTGDTIRQTAHKLLTKGYIQRRVQVLKDERSQRTKITADMVLQELAHIGFARVTDFVKVEVRKEEIIVPKKKKYKGEKEVDEDDDIEEALPEIVETSYKIVDVFETDTINQDKIRALASIKQGKNGIEVKIHDKTKALELIGRHLGMWNDKLKVDADEELKSLFKTIASAEGK